jgi:hypothetical protein
MQGIGIYTSAADIPAQKAKRSRHSLRTAVTINFWSSSKVSGKQRRMLSGIASRIGEYKL